jgi:hypothetical protein
MNCKPGDLAVIASYEEEVDRCTLGLIVRVTKIDPDWGEPVWEYEGEKICDSEGTEILAISDRFLRPIRDPGDDAQDETLDWLPSPTKQGEPA